MVVVSVVFSVAVAIFLCAIIFDLGQISEIRYQISEIIKKCGMWHDFMKNM